MYILPQPHKCSKCGHEKMYSPDNDWPAPRIVNFVGCPACWERWLMNNIGQMEPVDSKEAD